LDNPQAARDLIKKMRGEEGNACNGPCLPVVDGTHSNTYVLIHLMRWTDASTQEKPAVQSDHWYLYRDLADGKWSQEDFTTAKRILGATNIYVLIVHFNASKLFTAGHVSYQLDYDFTITKKAPANVAHLYSLLQTFAGGAQSETKPAAPGALPPAYDAVWSGGVLRIQYHPSDILIKSSYTPSEDTASAKLGDDISFDNEGLYYWDVTFAIPVKKIGEIKLDTTSGTATPSTVNSQNVFAILDGYAPPVDVKASGFNKVPHPIGGVAFAKRPLSKILIVGHGVQLIRTLYGRRLCKTTKFIGE